MTVDGVRLRCEEHWLRLDPDRHILYVELVYRRDVGGAWVEDAVLQIPRRYYAPDEFEQVIRAHGFRIIQRWGGYAGERLGLHDGDILAFALVTDQREEMRQ